MRARRPHQKNDNRARDTKMGVLIQRWVVGAASALVVAMSAGTALAAGGEPIHIERQDWSFSGFWGQYDNAQLQRGFQVYTQVCASCHGLSRVAFRNLVEPGGPEFPEEAVKQFAAEWPNKPIDGPNDEGKMFERPALLSDPILGPYRNDKEARAVQNGALPPDLSLITKARMVENHSPFYVHVADMLRDVVTGYQEAGSDYTYALLVGYKDPPAEFKMSDGMYYNAAFPGHQIAMPPPLSADNFTTYQDGTGSLEQNAKDLTAFLSWAADPHLEQRKRIGWQVMLYLLITTILLYIGKQRIWARVKH
jgi:cytochrome c1